MTTGAILRPRAALRDRPRLFPFYVPGLSVSREFNLDAWRIRFHCCNSSRTVASILVYSYLGELFDLLEELAICPSCHRRYLVLSAFQPEVPPQGPSQWLHHHHRPVLEVDAPPLAPRSRKLPLYRPM